VSPSSAEESAASVAAATAVAAALAPYGWRYLTDRMLARRAVAARDRHLVDRFVSSVPGIEVGADDPTGPADPHDARVAAAVDALSERRWREHTLTRLSVDLVALLAVWSPGRQAS
jgi:hypothetical protein